MDASFGEVNLGIVVDFLYPIVKEFGTFYKVRKCLKIKAKFAYILSILLQTRNMSRSLNYIYFIDFVIKAKYIEFIRLIVWLVVFFSQNKNRNFVSI